MFRCHSGTNPGAEDQDQGKHQKQNTVDTPGQDPYIGRVDGEKMRRGRTGVEQGLVDRQAARSVKINRCGLNLTVNPRTLPVDG